MQAQLLVPVLAAIIGMFVFFAVKQHAELKETGRLLMACGFLVTLFVLATKMVTFGGG